MTWLVGLAIPALLGGAWWATRHGWRVATVDGQSMAPALRPGDRVLVRRVRAGTLHRGDLVLVAILATPPGGWVIKRIAALPGDRTPAGIPGARARVPAGMLVVLGDNRDFSIDSREFGYVPAERVFGRITRRL